ncbi:Putative aliphatic aldoxime/phenylacetaldoxime dehydratase [Colletotrichum destructivum]|uniref:Aliphatic aldoxime/phenylacetaldoxime dehydratase n=1 Tax=Colletotrichum destructivum TaxID=34406 RepID=A0AAX4IUC3_9PEZI|nr:Putative aliphatic aldoxime/phenylacetaldoxime dehydratase [Colletotrichum destructivum]
MSFEPRTYPLRRPDGHRPPVPRWHLVLGDVKSVVTAYIGVQPHSCDSSTVQAVGEATAAIEAWLTGDEDSRPLASERFKHLDGEDAPEARIWVCYWDDPEQGKIGLQKLDLASIFAHLVPENQRRIGLWSESFATPITRLETNYSGLDYLPGLARLPGASTQEHTLSAYWGAARDRIPSSAHDLFKKDDAAERTTVEAHPKGLGQHLVGTNYDNMVHIRSGQFWENCGIEETESYEKHLEPTLKTGLTYLWENRKDGGAMGLRFLGNTDAMGHVRKETCGAGFFTDLNSLEEWSRRHRSHLAIYLGAIKHAKTFGDSRKFRTWHEVSVLKRGEAAFEYINCLPTTGVVRFVPLDVVYDLCC